MFSSVSKEEKRTALKKAVDSHKKYMSDAVAGKAIDRHFLGLRLLANEEIAKDPSKKMPAIFTDPVYKDSITWRISTSNITSPNMVCGFGPVVEDGYGVSYTQARDSIGGSILLL
jgi:carnitine O-acetyltransferase